MGTGSMTGRGLGFARRRGFGRGFGRGFASTELSPETKKELLLEQRDVLQNRLKVIDQQLEAL
jgi:hypothetical protein